MKYRGIFEYEYPTEHKPPVSIDVHLHGDCVKGKIIEWEYRPLEQEPRKGHWIGHREHCENLGVMPSGLGAYEWCSECDCGIDVREWHRNHYNFCPNCGSDNREVEE